jgi:nucleotide-binding universal stress UspA family protein
MPRQVLVTLDGSALSRSIMQYLPAILRPGDNIVLLTVGWATPLRRPRLGPSQPVAVGTSVFLDVAQPEYAEDQAHAIDRTKTELRDYLEDEGLFLRNEGFSVKCEALLDHDPARAIIAYAKEMGPLLIAMATHGRSGLSHAVNGSVAEQVVKSSVAPVLLIRP